MALVRAGELNERLAIERPVETRDTHGGVVENWTLVGDRWAKVEALSGRELERARMIEATVTHRVTIRALDQLEASYRFTNTDGTRPLGIVAVLRQGPTSETQSVLCKRLENACSGTVPWTRSKLLGR